MLPALHAALSKLGWKDLADQLAAQICEASSVVTTQNGDSLAAEKSGSKDSKGGQKGGKKSKMPAPPSSSPMQGSGPYPLHTALQALRLAGLAIKLKPLQQQGPQPSAEQDVTHAAPLSLYGCPACFQLEHMSHLLLRPSSGAQVWVWWLFFTQGCGCVSDCLLQANLVRCMCKKLTCRQFLCCFLGPTSNHFKV